MPHFGLDPGLRPRPVRSAGLRAEPEQVGIAERNPTPGGRYDDRPWMDASPDREGTGRHANAPRIDSTGKPDKRQDENEH